VNGRERVAEYLLTHPTATGVYIIALGKAACAMAQGARQALGDGIRDALVVTKRGHTEFMPWPVLEAGHPLPNETSLEAGERLTRFAAAIPEAAQVLVLLSGGASSLVERLPSGVSLEQLREIYHWLLASGLDITACNRLRRCLSRVKGGRLAALLSPRKVLCLAISDVPDDDPRVIGSGLLVAEEELDKGLPMAKIPNFVREAVKYTPPAPPPDDACFRHVHMEIIATLGDAMKAAAGTAAKLGYQADMRSDFVTGDAVAAGRNLARQLIESEPGRLFIWGGETTLTLPASPGRGGRNQSLALAAALVLEGRENILFLAVGTDGTDGPTGDAGALVDGGTVARGELAGLHAQGALAAADAGRFLEASGDLVHTGPTGTNVMDIMLGLKF